MLYVNPKYPQILSKSLKTVLLIRFYAFLTKKQKKKTSQFYNHYKLSLETEMVISYRKSPLVLITKMYSSPGFTEIQLIRNNVTKVFLY